MAGALDGIIVADFSRVLAGPYASMLLGDLGATIIKIERPHHGDDLRHLGPPFDARGRATYFEAVNRNKQSVEIDLMTDAGRAKAREIALSADIVIENYVPGVMAKYGLDYETLSALKPELIYCSITGFGEQPQAAHLQGYDLIAQAAGGLMSITGEDSEHMVKVGVPVADLSAGMHAVMGIQAALIHRMKSGEGQRVSINLMSSVLSILTNQAAAWVNGGVVGKPMGNVHPSIAPYQVYQTSDVPMILAVASDGQFVRLAKAINQPELASDPRFIKNADRIKNQTQLNDILIPLFMSKTAREWSQHLGSAGVPTGPLNTIDRAVEYATELGLNPVVMIDDDGFPVAQIAHPVGYSKTPPTYRNAPPQLGSSNDLYS